MTTIHALSPTVTRNPFRRNSPKIEPNPEKLTAKSPLTPVTLSRKYVL
jgi:hypothetical protein